MKRSLALLFACGVLGVGVGCGSNTEPADSASGGQGVAGSSAGAAVQAGVGGSYAGASSAGVGGSTLGGGSGNAGASDSGGGAGGSAGGASGNAGAPGGGGAASAGAAGRAAGGTGGTGGTGGSSAGMSGVGGTVTQPAVDRAATIATVRKVADYYLKQVGTNYKNDWIRSAFYVGLMAAYRTTNDAKYLDATKTWAAANAYKVSTADKNGPRFADNQTCFQSYLEIYDTAPTAANAAMVKDVTTVFDSMVAAPKTGRVEWWWVDALFMAPGGLSRAADSLSKPGYLTLMHNMFWDTKAFLFDPKTQLFWRDNNAHQNTPTVYWARGNGWAIAGTARVHETLPVGDARRADYEQLLKDMAAGLKPWQDATDGMWRSDLRNPARFPNPEASGTAFFTFGMAYGVHHGILDRATYLPVVLKAWNGLLNTALTAEGRVGYTQQVGAAPAAAARNDTEDYSVGGFLLAASEVIDL